MTSCACGMCTEGQFYMLLEIKLTKRVFARSERGRYRRMSAKTSAGKSSRPREDERKDSLSLQLGSELSEKLVIVFLSGLLEHTIALS